MNVFISLYTYGLHRKCLTYCMSLCASQKVHKDSFYGIKILIILSYVYL